MRIFLLRSFGIISILGVPSKDNIDTVVHSKYNESVLCYRRRGNNMRTFASDYNSFFSNDSAGAFTITDSTNVQILVIISTNKEE